MVKYKYKSYAINLLLLLLVISIPVTSLLIFPLTLRHFIVEVINITIILYVYDYLMSKKYRYNALVERRNTRNRIKAGLYKSDWKLIRTMLYMECDRTSLNISNVAYTLYDRNYYHLISLGDLELHIEQSSEYAPVYTVYDTSDYSKIVERDGKRSNVIELLPMN